jgi:gamma-glutamyltranspeptidase/glutathione hydrolase
MGRRGMVCAGHPLAAQAGIAVLQAGGNAVDAALAVGAALNVAEPPSSGIGGAGYFMVYWRQTGEIRVANGSGVAPGTATPAAFRDGGIPLYGILSVAVPGLVDTWLAVHDRYGSLPLAQVLDAGIALAEEGCPVSHKLAATIERAAPLRDYPASAAVFLPDGRPLRAGEVMRNSDLAGTFRRIAADGRDGFYAGPVAQAIAHCSEQLGGLLTREDLAAYRMLWQDPIPTTYRSHTVYEVPPNSSGFILLEELNLIEPFDLPALGWGTAESVHLMVEAKRLAFADRERYVADIDAAAIPLHGLLSKEYARDRARRIDPERALQAPVAAGDPWRWQPTGATGSGAGRTTGVHALGEDTTCFAVVDRWGNAVCELQSLHSGFGSGVVADGTGVLLNNRMAYWHLDPSHPNVLAPGKRVRHTMNPAMVFRGDALHLVLGTPGGDTQVQTNLQLITAMLDFAMTPQEAVEAPRWRHVQPSAEPKVPHTDGDALQMEARFPRQTRDGLGRRGHQILPLDEWGGPGSAVAIQVDPSAGTLHGAADPRQDGYAIGW